MNRVEIEERVIALISETMALPVEEMSDPATNLREDLGMDSMDFVDLLVDLERHLGHRVDRELLVDIRTVGQVVDLVDDLAARRAQADAAEAIR
ncbi:acyl carrier protein [Nocardia brasiliensis NBRC 14402]|uniref:Acyl carrier protein n=1 Tax=Nocardia brasiliensis (strain ATCC 700358 / HUJEG-1) TaxID=1133849 RepID=K0F239_NOCB7|nr:acyl carrier protein [Nocardia brasiliensis]AFU03757.1 acyl carrier protein [Nocardia brasiliensis ATCC 700358]ASF06333.1 acyl carrier protein [Nocardia brasiliensis]OCF89517.1 acyl carrier protein [Nocardia brasiliensis]SUB54037.1 Acyl carrier protein [Nocardia brasiliensis]GAJ81283.1 acyl carrier protein [Nocardia brasiliensis NBRC 14402]